MTPGLYSRDNEMSSASLYAVNGVAFVVVVYPWGTSEENFAEAQRKTFLPVEVLPHFPPAKASL